MANFARKQLICLSVLFLCSCLGVLVYMVDMPIRQVYWGVTARLRDSWQSTANQALGSNADPDDKIISNTTKLENALGLEPTVESVLVNSGSRDADGADARSDSSFDAKPMEVNVSKVLEEVQKRMGGSSTSPSLATSTSREGRDAPPQRAALPQFQQWTGKVDDYMLTREMVEAVAEDGVVMVTWANLHYLDFVLSWADHVRGLGVGAYLVGALDDDLLAALANRSINTFAMRAGLSHDDFGWGSPQFHKMGRQKISLVHQFTDLGFSILVSDVDTVWLQNPLPYMKQYPAADILTSSDHLSPTTTDGGLEKWPDAGSAANIGIMLFRPSAKALAKEWQEVLDDDATIWDQNAFNDLFRRQAHPVPDQRQDRLFKCYDGQLLCGILPVSTFCSGHTYFVQRLPEAVGRPPYVVHATFQFSGTPGKRHRMRERLLWNEDAPEQHFSPSGGLLVYSADVPQELLDKAVVGAFSAKQFGLTLETSLFHFRLVNHQLLQLRNAMAVAQALGRVLVLPELWCGLDRWWAPHNGVIPGSATTLPFRCPLDHVLDLEQMTRHMPWEEFGGAIDFREYSLLSNPHMPANTTASILHVAVCEGAGNGCNNGSISARPETNGTVRLAPGLNDKQIVTALEEFKDVKVLNFSSMIHAFGSHAEQDAADRFKRRLDLYSSLWCCVDGHPGHVWYDFWWDTEPHHDRHERWIEGPWYPQLGP